MLFLNQMYIRESLQSDHLKSIWHSAMPYLPLLNYSENVAQKRILKNASMFRKAVDLC